MILTERHIINKENKEFKTLDNLCFLSKNLYNSCLYTIKNHYEATGHFLRYNELEKLFRESGQKDYLALPNNSSQQILMLFDKNIKSYFGLLKKYKKSKTSLSGVPKFPKYKDKLKGRNIVIFTENQARLHGNIIKFPKKTNLKPLTTKVNNIKQVRIIPQNSCYVIEVIYEVAEQPLLINENKAAIDLGLNNLALLSFNNSANSYIFNGKPLKAINQYYNKKLGKLKSKLPHYLNHKGEKVQKGKSNKTIKLTNKRNNKINDYLHKSSKQIIQKLKENNISEIAVGYNPEWKQNINIGKKNNQKFVSIPFLKFIDKIVYKCQQAGIKVLLNEESYTSKASALDLDFIPVYGFKSEDGYNFSGYRAKRGLYRRKGLKGAGSTINADLNGSLNIGRKVFGNGYVERYIEGISRGYVAYPVKITS